MVAGDRPDGDAHRLQFGLPIEGALLSGAPHQIARLWHRQGKARVKLFVASVGFQCSIRRPAPSGRVQGTVVRTTRLKLAATGA
jgi:hypothetical protein